MVIRSLEYADSRLHNWATDLAAGAQFYYTLSVVIISRLMAIFLTN
jgi:Mn2+/Fe2+ NRAMP family transporter